MHTSRLSRTVVTFLLWAAALYVLLCVALLVFQRSLIYFPQPRAIDNPNTLLKLPIEDAEVLVSTRPLPGRKALIYFGGNAEDVSLNLAQFAQAFADHALYLLHYRGYGGSGGSPSEAAIQADALAGVHSECAAGGPVAVLPAGQGDVLGRADLHVLPRGAGPAGLGFDGDGGVGATGDVAVCCGGGLVGGVALGFIKARGLDHALDAGVPGGQRGFGLDAFRCQAALVGLGAADVGGQLRDLVRLMARNLDAVKKDLARRRSVNPRNEVKYRGFAGPIRPNQGVYSSPSDI